MKVRASGLVDLFDCPARWEAKNVLEMRLPTSGSALLGIAVHAGTAAYDLARMSQNMITVDDAACVVVDVLFDKNNDVDWGDDKPKELESTALSLHKMYCEEVSPYHVYVGVEVKCDDLVIKDLDITLTGTTDRVFTDVNSGAIGIADIKTGKSIVSPDGTVSIGAKALQLGVYELLVESALNKPVTLPAKVIGLQAGKTSKGQRCAIGTVAGAKDMLIGDGTRPGVLEHAAHILKSGMFPGNPRSQMCSSRYCPCYNICNFHK